MTLAEIKANHPTLVEQILKENAEKTKEGIINAERDRVGSWMVYIDVDPKAVKEGITEGKTLSATQQAEFGRLLIAQGAKGKLEKENPDGKKPGSPATEEQKTKEEEAEAEKNKELEDFETNVVAIATGKKVS